MEKSRNIYIVLASLILALALAGCQNPFLQLGEGSVQAGVSSSGTISPPEILLPESPPAEFWPGTGTPGDPFLVYDIETLQRVGNEGEGEGEWGLTKHYKQIADIDMADAGNWETIGIKKGGWFTGTYDGNGKIISNLSSNYNGTNSDYLGLFRAIGGTVMNLGLVNAKIEGDWCVGGIVGENGGEILNCFFKGIIKCDMMYGGGITGNNGGIVEKCYSEGIFEGGRLIGGVTGVNFGAIKNCYSTGDCSGEDFIGGAVGQNSGPLLNCYATGMVSGTDIVGGITGYVTYPMLGPPTSAINCVALNEFIYSSTDTIIGRVFGANDEDGPEISNNYANPEMFVNDVIVPESGENGEDITGDYHDIGWWTTEAVWATGEAWDFETVWTWGSNDLPILRNVGGQ